MSAQVTTNLRLSGQARWYRKTSGHSSGGWSVSRGPEVRIGLVGGGEAGSGKGQVHREEDGLKAMKDIGRLWGQGQQRQDVSL